MRTTDAPKTSTCHAFAPQGHARAVERAAGVHPAEVADEPLLAEGQLLPADARGDRRLGVADVGERHPQIERPRNGAVGRADFLVGDARVLHLHLERQAAWRP